MGLGPGQRSYKFMKAVFMNPVAQWLFRRLLHPSFAMGIASRSSKASRQAHGQYDDIDKAEDEYLYQYVKASRLHEGDRHDYFIFGHRHLPSHLQISPTQQMLVLGDWIRQFTYIEIDESGPQLLRLCAPN